MIRPAPPAVLQRGIEVRLGDVELELRSCAVTRYRRSGFPRSQPDSARDASARKEILREREPEVVLVLRAEAQAAEGRERISSQCAAVRVLETRQTLVGRSRRIAEILIARRGRRRGLGRVDRRRGTADARNCEASVRVYDAVPPICGKNWLRAWYCSPWARSTPARAIRIFSLWALAMRIASGRVNARGAVPAIGTVGVVGTCAGGDRRHQRGEEGEGASESAGRIQ